MKIIFLRAYDFPIGGAPQNRLLGICKGLIGQGCEVEVHQFSPSKLNFTQNLLAEQIYRSIKIYNHAWRWSPANNKLRLLIGIISGYFLTLIAVIKSNRRSKVDYIFINVAKNSYIFPVYILSRIIGAKLGRELNEYPSFILNSSMNKLVEFYKKNTNYKWFDVLFIMTNILNEYYLKLGKKKVKSLILPMTVDINRFPYLSNTFHESNYITYCGDLSETKDGVITLVRAFALIVTKYPDAKLKLIGTNKDLLYIKKLHQIIAELGLSDRVIFTGFIHADELPQELYKSRLLVLSRPTSMQSMGGFPTKLGEYLATGIPVAVTKVGELPLYLKDEVNSFLAEPDNVTSFADAMCRSLGNIKLSMEVGKNGRATAIKYFSSVEQGVLMSEFLMSNR